MPLQAIQDALDRLRAGTLDTPAFCSRLRREPLPPELPPKFKEVLDNLLDRMESGALFGAESCSFSPQELHAGFQLWIDKARERLGAA